MKTNNPTVLAAWKSVSRAHGTANLAYSCFTDLGALFQAIADSSNEGSQAHKLANIGGYLASDWASTHDSEREEMERHFAVLSAALEMPSINNEGSGK
ncbi:hypothetical protein [Aromatoleum anaerobium]|uniref:Uncharacterized protein n=1 Tax=Aromatoleum anaerobium TaxID=182180 RepID=A0ABX1PQK9_9RHOO|nr:hypothetical protein [Aromatoleum anaerobium]MCK0508480.1 hypothetical protein [Aromatoleum anaerobium]